MKKNKLKNKRGITLVELLLYVSLVSIVVLSISSFFILILQDNAKSQIITNVNDQGKFAINIINRAIREASDVINPTVGIPSNSLVLRMDDLSKDPTVFSVDNNGILSITEGISNSVSLTNSRVIFSGIKVGQIINSIFSTTPDGGNKNISFDFNLKTNNTNTSFEYNYSKNFTGGMTLRPDVEVSNNGIYTLNYTAGSNGSIIGALHQVVNSGFSGTVVEAVPNANYYFVKWNDTNSTDPVRIDTNVNHNIASTAEFAVDTYTLTYTAGANGEITGDKIQVVSHSNPNGTEVIAVADPGYHFENWSDSVLTLSRTDLDVSGNITVTANFDSDSFICGDDSVIYEGESYPTVLIGTQCWFAKNLAYLPSVVPKSTGDDTNPYYYVYDYSGTDVDVAKLESNYITYGVLYNHPAALTACPSGWHLPDNTEFSALETYLGGSDVAGGKLKEIGTTHWVSPNTGADNSSGLTALPAGYRVTMMGPAFSSLGTWTNLWSSSFSGLDAWYLTMGTYDSIVSSYNDNPAYGFSVRCLQDL